MVKYKSFGNKTKITNALLAVNAFISKNESVQANNCINVSKILTITSSQLFLWKEVEFS